MQIKVFASVDIYEEMKCQFKASWYTSVMRIHQLSTLVFRDSRDAMSYV